MEAEIAEVRGALARETLTEERLDRAGERIAGRLAAIPGGSSVSDEPGDRSAVSWAVGDRAIADSGSAESRPRGTRSKPWTAAKSKAP